MVVGELTVETDLLVIGGGPGGYVAAIRAAQLGLDVTLAEAGSIGGICLNVGCIPSKALISVANRYHDIFHSEKMGIVAREVGIDIEGVMNYKRSVVSRLTSGVAALLESNGVNVLWGVATFLSKNSARVQMSHEVQRVVFKNAIVATGSKVTEIPAFPFDHEVICDSTDALAFTEIPKSLVVVGGGYIGLEIGIAYRKLGAEVAIVEAEDHILGAMERQLSSVVLRRLKAIGVQVELNSRVEAIKLLEGEAGRRGELSVATSNGTLSMEADKILVAVGRKANTDNLGLEHIGVELDQDGFIKVDEKRRTNVSTVFAIGDVAGGPMLAHKASYEGKVAAAVAAGHNDAYEPTAVPAVVFTDPEIASVGITESEARDRGYEVRVTRFPFGAIGRAVSMDETEGLCQLVYEKDSGTVLGLHLVGPEVTELLGEASILVEFGANLEDISRTIHAHPTLAEVFAEAAEAAQGYPVHQAPRIRK